MDGRNRKEIRPGLEVEIVLKQDQRTRRRTRGIVREILTRSQFHPHGIKVRLESGEVGRVQAIIERAEGDQRSTAERFSAKPFSSLISFMFFVSFMACSASLYYDS